MDILQFQNNTYQQIFTCSSIVIVQTSLSLSLSLSLSHTHTHTYTHTNTHIHTQTHEHTNTHTRTHTAATAAAAAAHTYLPQVALTRLVALEAVLITALLFTQLAVPAQALQALGFDPVADLQAHVHSKCLACDL